MPRTIHWIAIALLGIVQPFLYAQEVTIEFRFAQRHPGPGLREVAVSGSREPIYLHPEVVLSEADVASAQVIRSAKRAQVKLLLTPAGTKKLAELTKNNLGRQLAILVNDRPVSAPIIQASVRSGQIVLNGLSSEREARHIVDSLASRQKSNR